MAKAESLVMGLPEHNSDGEKHLHVRRGRVESVDLYEIKDTELDTLEKGTPASLNLNFAIFLLSLAFSAIASITTATFADDAIKFTFIVIAVIGVLLGGVLLIKWYTTKSEIGELCKKIRHRIPPEPILIETRETEGYAQSALLESVEEEEPPKG